MQKLQQQYNQQHENKNITLCSFCGYPSKKLLKCTVENCNHRTCKGCTIFINNKPFCHECMINFMKKDIKEVVFKYSKKIERLIK